MSLHDKILEVYQSVKSYPDLVQKLIELGIQSYTVDVATGSILYRLADGENLLHVGEVDNRSIFERFSADLTVMAIRDNQQGKTTYPEFMHAIGAAGVRFYEATLTGENKRVTYIGFGGFYEESIPI
ncbi:DUF1398 family protein [Solitalea lacus]|uniref:DUF1398 family protein n=1 Tax=Solitalea lacus TaxID=2911172 RepID=UPI001EDA4232|nr:DUF1398 family protein [Solitalea lacus]UKJ05783.1 DUF1398 family protein [Solitalea lacus]